MSYKTIKLTKKDNRLFRQENIEQLQPKYTHARGATHDRTEGLRLDGRGWAAAAQIEAIRLPAELMFLIGRPIWILDRLSKLYPLSSFQTREEEVPARLQKCGGLLALFVRCFTSFTRNISKCCDSIFVYLWLLLVCWLWIYYSTAPEKIDYVFEFDTVGIDWVGYD